jgi:putative PIN family toxin of toxin-antitoxin system
LDVGVLVAAHISGRGAPAALYRSWLRRRFDLVVSPGLLAKLGEVLARPKFTAYTDPYSIAAFLWVIRRFGVLLADPLEVPSVTADPEDDRVVALAKTAAADALVSGDRHILEAGLTIPVFTPSDFLVDLGPDPSEPLL